jgi:hypothetical protein
MEKENEAMHSKIPINQNKFSQAQDELCGHDPGICHWCGRLTEATRGLKTPHGAFGSFRRDKDDAVGTEFRWVITLINAKVLKHAISNTSYTVWL